MSPRVRVLVTGATGFVGRAVVSELCDAGHDVSALVRGSDAEARAKGLGIAAGVQPGSLEDEDVVRGAVAGVDVVVHLAALVDPRLLTDSEQVRHVNRELTVRLATVARSVGVKRFVFMSSIAAMGFWSGHATAESPCQPLGSYGEAKLAAERELLSMQSPDFEVVVLRPPTVYGPGEPYNFLTWVRAIERGLFRVVGDGQNRFPLVTTRNLAVTTRAAVEGRLGPGLFLVADAELYSMKRIHTAIRKSLGQRGARLSLPLPVAIAGALANEALARVSPRVPLVLSRSRLRTLTADQRLDVEPLQRAGVDLDAPLEAWVELTVADYRRRGLLRR
jgi:nucleoside-diphosphate-sugar epimerase